MSVTKEQLENEIQQLSIPTGNSILDEKRAFRKKLLENYDSFEHLPHEGICPVCGNYGEIFPANNNEICPMCGTTTILLPFSPVSPNIKRRTAAHDKSIILHDILDKTLDLDNPNDLGYVTGTTIDATLFQENDNKARNKIKEENDRKTPSSPSIPAKPVPRCPTCGSTKVKNISGTKRWLTVGLFGLASSDMGKQRQCGDCGYKW